MITSLEIILFGPLNMSKISQYKLFVEVVETGSISRAAAKFNYSTPAVSKQISNLESSLNVQLFNRSHKKLEITDSGKKFYPRCKKILAEITQAEDELIAHEDAVSGKISITLSKSVARSKIFEAISSFSKEFPKTYFEFSFSDNFEDLYDKNIDFGLRLGKLQDSSNMIALPLLNTRLVACASPEFVRRNSIPKHFSELPENKLVLMSPHSSSSALKNFFYGEKFNPKNTETHLCDDIEGVYQAVYAGLGIGLMLDVSIREELETGQLIEVFKNKSLPKKQLYLIFKKSKWKTQKFTAFKDHMKSFFNKE